MDVGTTFSMGYYSRINTFGNGILHFNGCNVEMGDNNFDGGLFVEKGLVVFENRVKINDNENNKVFKVGNSSDVKLLSTARIVLDGTTTFSVL